MGEPDLKDLSRAELEAEVMRLRAALPQEKAFGRPVRSTPAGRDELFSAIEKTRMPMILTDPNQLDDPIVFANRAFQDLSGYSSDELVGRNCRFLQGPDTDPAQVQRIRDALRDKRDIALDLMNYRRDGTPFLNELYISPVLGSGGEVLYHFGSQLDVTGYRKDRSQLESVERRQRAVLASAVGVAIIATDRDGLVTDWNTGAVEIFGWPADEMRGQPADRFFTPEDRAGDRVATEMRLSMEEGRASDERWHLRKDGRRFWASGEMMPMRDEHGTHIGYIKIVRDRTAEHEAGTALRDAEARLRESEDHFRHTVELNPQVPWTCDPQGNITSYSPRWLELTGQSPGEPLGAGWAKALHPDDLPHTMAVFGACLASGEPVDVDYRIHVAAAGDYRWMRARAYPRRDENGTIVRWYGVVEDIHDRRRAEDALKVSEAHYRNLFDRIDEGFCIIEFIDGPHGPLSDYMHIEANPACERQLGIAGMVGRTIRDIGPGEADDWLDIYGSVLRSGQPIQFEREFVTNRRHLEVAAHRIEPASRRQVAVLFRDITARKQAETALRASEAVAREAVQRVQLALSAGAIIGTWHWDLPTDRFAVDEGFAQSFGLDPALGHDGIPLAQIVATVHPDDQAGLAAAIDEAVQRGGAYAHQYRVRRADGRYYWLEANGRVDHAADGTPLSFPGVLIDLEDRRALVKERDRALTVLREGEQRRAALLELSDKLTAEDADTGRMTDLACEILGRTLGVQLVGYGLVNPQAETITVERDWTSGGAKSLTGTLQFRQFGSYIEDIKRGRTVVVTDARTDPRTRDHAAALEALSARAFVNAPVFEHGRSVALLYVSTGATRDWSEEELTFIREVAARTRAATARRQAENAVRAREAELRLVTDTLPFLVAFVDTSLTYLFVNAAYRQWFDVSPDEVLGRTIWELAGPESFAERRPAIDRALAGEPTQIDVVWPWPDGRRRVAEIRYLPRRDASGAVEGLYAFAQDVTAVRDAAALLAERADTLTEVVAQRTADLDRVWRMSQELLVVALPDGIMEAVNPLWTELLGWSERELVGSNFTEYTHPDDLAQTAEVFAGVLNKPLNQAYEYRFRHKDGSYRWFAWTAAFEAGRVYAAGRDVTREREQAEQLIQSQKMEAVGQLTGGLAHDFNNLLAGISGSLELMNSRINQGRLKDVEKYMVAAQGASKRAAALTHRLLAFSRRQTLAPKATDVNKLIGGMLDLIQRTVGPSIELENVGASGLWSALVDASQLENALLNLCINARDAMPKGGKITIETGNRWIDRHGAKQHDMPEGQYLSMCVSDTGTGMPPDVIARAFDPFFTTKPIGEGTGLGLSMIYGFAKQSGGQVRIYSEVGEGTNVCIYLPRHVGVAERDESEPDSGMRPFAEAGETVLIVDDEPTVRMLVADVLEELGYTAVEASDGAGGLRVLHSDARVDLLVTDVGLPGGMNGRQMADAARVGRPSLKVLFITGFAENALLHNGQLEPGMAVLTKPFAVDTLAARIRELIKA